VCCSVLQCAAVWCSVSQYVAVCCRMLQYVAADVEDDKEYEPRFKLGVVCISMCCRVLPRVPVCTSVLQCVTVCYSASQWMLRTMQTIVLVPILV